MRYRYPRVHNQLSRYYSQAAHPFNLLFPPRCYYALRPSLAKLTIARGMHWEGPRQIALNLAYNISPFVCYPLITRPKLRTNVWIEVDSSENKQGFDIYPLKF